MSDGYERLSLEGVGGAQTTRGTVCSFPMHAHAFYEMTLYEPFDGCIILNGQEVRVPGRTVVLVTPNDLHRICADGCDSPYIKVVFDGAILPAGLLPEAAVVCRDVAEGGLMQRLFQELLTVGEDALHASLLIAAAVYDVTKSGTSVTSGRRASRHGLAVRAAKRLNERFCEDISLASVAKALSVTPQYLSKVFSEEMGVKFSEYLSELRLRYAAELLQLSERSVTEVCYACGYGNLSHFLRCFKRRFGVTPKEYMKKH